MIHSIIPHEYIFQQEEIVAVTKEYWHDGILFEISINEQHEASIVRLLQAPLDAYLEEKYQPGQRIVYFK